MHVVLLFLFWRLEPLRNAVLEALPVTVTIVAPPKAAPPVPLQVHPLEISEPQPLPVPPVLIAVTPSPDAPVVVATQAPPPQAMPRVDEGTVVQPRFDADYLQNPAPVYPILSKRRREQGKVMLRVLVGVNGQPENIEIQKSSGFERLDAAALETVRHWKFVPARRGETAVAAWALVPISFSLNS